MALWNLTDELLAILGAESVSAGFRAAGLEVGDELCFTTVRDWYRAGGESYVYVFDVSDNQQSFRLLLKSLVGSVGGLEYKFKEVLERRRLLEHRGIGTPKLYGHHKATLLEEFVPYTLREALSRPGDDMFRAALDAIRLGTTLDSLGFAPVSLFPDLRSHGANAVLVDFGSDLGPPHASPGGRLKSYTEAIEFVHSCNGLTLPELESWERRKLQVD
ncbi:hypothetical protein [Mycobacterium sp. OAE908]|uniref:hypothetical protein n=1 Tax=Mycobacterium sp. OAE908 TaxID=2817899 RepID=UPI001AE3EFC0